MKILLMLAAAGYIIYAIANIWHRPGYFAAVYMLTYGLAVFFGSIGPITGAIAIFASFAAMNAQKQQIVIIPGEYAFIAWLGMLAFSMFTTPRIDVTVEYVALAVFLATGSYLYGRAFATHPRFFEDLFFGGLFITAICAVQTVISTNTLELIGATAGMSHVGLAVLPELCLVGMLSYLLFHRGHSRLVTAGMLLYLYFVLVPFTLTLGTRSVILSIGFVFLVQLVLRAWHGGVARLLLGIAGGTIALTALIAAFWSDIQMTKLGLLISFGTNRLMSGLATGGVQADASSLTRIQLYDEGWNIFYRHPLFGSGAGAFGYLADGASGAYPHNMILEILVQSGVVGLLLFFVFCIPLVLRGIRDALQKPASWTAVFGLSLFASAFVRHQVSMSITEGKLLFLALGCFAAHRIYEQQRSGQEPAIDGNSAPEQLTLPLPLNPG